MNALGFRHDLDHRLRSRKAIDLKETCQVIDDYTPDKDMRDICAVAIVPSSDDLHLFVISHFATLPHSF